MNNAKYFPTVQIQVESMLNIPYVSNNPLTILINHLLLPGSTSIIWNEMNMLKLCVWILCRSMAPCGIHYVSTSYFSQTTHSKFNCYLLTVRKCMNKSRNCTTQYVFQIFVDCLLPNCCNLFWSNLWISVTSNVSNH